MNPQNQPIRRALISVSDKTGLVEFARFLADSGVALASTGGSAKALREAGIAVLDVSDLTGFPEIMDGRVKTLHPKVHGAILARRDLASHMRAAQEHDIGSIDLVVVNLYPFEATVESGAGREAAIENIDIGGPALIRAAAKNHEFVTVLVDPADYGDVRAEMERNAGATGIELRRRLAAKAFRRTAAYDAAIGRWMAGVENDLFPERLVLAGTRRQVLRYGENPHQRAAFYVTGGARPGLAAARQLQGKELSYNNLNDTDAALELVAEFDEPAIAIIKHANPCGVAIAGDLAEAYRKALACDPVSAYGGIIAANRALDGATAELIGRLFAEVVIAPAFEPAAIAALERKQNLRLLETGAMPDRSVAEITFRSLRGGVLVQERDALSVDPADLRVVTRRKPDAREMRDLLFAFTVAKHVKSNAIVYARSGATVGIGAGQMSRVDSSRIAAWKAREAARAAGESGSWADGSVAASDAFFPFADGLLAAAEAGAGAIIQPGGSLRDQEIIKAADDKGLAMVLTGTRHFRH